MIPNWFLHLLLTCLQVEARVMLRLWLKFARVVVASGIGIGFYPRYSISVVYIAPFLQSLSFNMPWPGFPNLCSDKYFSPPADVDSCYPLQSKMQIISPLLAFILLYVRHRSKWTLDSHSLNFGREMTKLTSDQHLRLSRQCLLFRWFII